MLVRSDGTLHGVGFNYSGNLGLGDTTTRTVVTPVGTDTDWVDAKANGTYFSHALKSNGELYSCGANGDGQLGLGDVSGIQIFTKVDGTWGTIILGQDNTFAGEAVYIWE